MTNSAELHLELDVVVSYFVPVNGELFETPPVFLHPPCSNRVLVLQRGWDRLVDRYVGVAELHVYLLSCNYRVLDFQDTIDYNSLNPNTITVTNTQQKS